MRDQTTLSHLRLNLHQRAHPRRAQLFPAIVRFHAQCLQLFNSEAQF